MSAGMARFLNGVHERDNVVSVRVDGQVISGRVHLNGDDTAFVRPSPDERPFVVPVDRISWAREIGPQGGAERS